MALEEPDPFGGDTELNEEDPGNTGNNGNNEDTSSNSSGNRPEIDHFEVEETTDKVRISFEVNDVDNDMRGGELMLTAGASTLYLDYPNDIREDNDGEFVLMEHSDFEREKQVTFRLTATDSTGLTSSTASTTFTLSAFSVTANEVGDDVSDVDGLGKLQFPAEIHGNTHSASNSGGSYTGDIDVMKFTSSASGVHSFSLSWDASAGDYDLYLAEIDGTIIEYSSGSSHPEAFTAAISNSTDYLLMVGAWSGPPGDWTIRIE